MLILAVTHPDPISRNPRSLSEGGRQQAFQAARRLRELVGKRVSLTAVISSPKARCLETAILIAREFGETTRDDGTYDGHIHVVPELDETHGAANSVRNLNETIRPFLHDSVEAADKGILLAVHGDLANMLISSTTFSEEAASGGWFKNRPVIAIFDYAPGKIMVRHCETIKAGSWTSCLSSG